MSISLNSLKQLADDLRESVSQQVEYVRIGAKDGVTLSPGGNTVKVPFTREAPTTDYLAFAQLAGQTNGYTELRITIGNRYKDGVNVIV